MNEEKLKNVLKAIVTKIPYHKEYKFDDFKQLLNEIREL